MVKNPPANAGDSGDSGLIPGSGRSPGGGNGNLLQYSCLGNPMDRGAWWATVHRGHKGLKVTLHASKAKNPQNNQFYEMLFIRHHVDTKIKKPVYVLQNSQPSRPTLSFNCLM